MKHINYISYFLLALFNISIISCSNGDDLRLDTGITQSSWREGESLEIIQGSELSVNFTAAAKWTASIGKGAEWCKLNKSSGAKGQNTIKLSVSTSSATDRTAKISINTEGYSPASFEVVQKGNSSQSAKDEGINKLVDEFLREMYLWNNEYKTQKPDYAKSYDNFFYDALGSMTTNTLDKKTYTGSDGKTYYSLFSYIRLLPDIGSTRSTKIVDKELVYSSGITGITPVSIGSQSDYTIYFCIQGVYPDSPASQAGLKRGAMVSLIDGKKISNGNYAQYYNDLLLPGSASHYTLTEDIIEGGTITRQKEYSITTKAMYNNPVILSQVREDIEGHRIGYLIYDNFDAGFDQELFNAFKEFKSKSVTDLILDLRYNGGGHVMSANLIASCIAGTASKGQVFCSFRYNEERMKKYGNKRPEEKFAYSQYPNLDTSLSTGGLDLPRVYCLVGNNTASASELVINSLKGIGLDVILIGEKTTGKNVGMESVELKAEDKTYEVAPITFQSYNAKGFSDYEKGFEPDFVMDETNPYNEQGIFFIHKEYGSDKEPLYAKAVELITGKDLTPTTRGEAVKAVNGRTRKMPVLFRPGHGGMLMPAKTAE